MITLSAMNGQWNLQHTYQQLPSDFYKAVSPEPVTASQLVLFNEQLARDLGLETKSLVSEKSGAVWVGNKLPEGASPIAQAYAGHQFTYFTILGDGRAILLGEQITPEGKRFDIQLKGSGQTPYSRRGDGRAALGPMLREFIISEAMHALGIPTTRSLAVATTGEWVQRERPLPGAVLTRVASSHIRVGTFQFAAQLKDLGALEALANYTIQRHYPQMESHPQKYLGFLNHVIDRQAKLIAQWLNVGFIHGVMNTDNVSIAGETIDFGPCAFLDIYDPSTVFSSIDHGGRYAFGNQPQIAEWNLARFAETLLPLLDSDKEKSLALAEEALGQFAGKFQSYFVEGMWKKLGITMGESQDVDLLQTLLNLMQKYGADFTNTFRALSAPEEESALEGIEALFKSEEFRAWKAKWIEKIQKQGHDLATTYGLMKKVNPFLIPRNHQVQKALNLAEENQNFAPIHRLIEALRNPFDQTPENWDLTRPPQPHERVEQTFCGT